MNFGCRRSVRAGPPLARGLALLIAGQYAIDLTRPLPGAGGGLPAFAATDRRGDSPALMAIQLHRFLPARSDAIRQLARAAGLRRTLLERDD